MTGEILSIGTGRRLLHDEQAIKYQTRSPGGDWSTRAVLEYDTVEEMYNFLGEVTDD